MAGIGSFSRPAIGSFLLVIVCVLWVFSSELTQFIFANLAFSRPYFFTWFATSMFQFYLVGFLVCKPWRQRCVLPLHKHYHSNRSAPTLLRRAIKVSFVSHDPNSVSLLNPTAQSQYGCHPSHEHSRSSAPRVGHVFAFCFFSHVLIATVQIATVSEIAKISSVLFVLWFLANLAFNVSLECTSVAANTVLSSSRCLPCCPFNSIPHHSSSPSYTVLFGP